MKSTALSREILQAIANNKEPERKTYLLSDGLFSSKSSFRGQITMNTTWFPIPVF